MTAAVVVIVDQDFVARSRLGRLAPFPKGAELGSRGKAGRRGRLIYQEPPPSGGGISGGNLETNGFKLRSGCSLEGCGEWNHESRSFKLPREVQSSPLAVGGRFEGVDLDRGQIDREANAANISHLARIVGEDHEIHILSGAVDVNFLSSRLPVALSKAPDYCLRIVREESPAAASSSTT